MVRVPLCLSLALFLIPEQVGTRGLMGGHHTEVRHNNNMALFKCYLFGAHRAAMEHRRYCMYINTWRYIWMSRIHI